MLPVGGHEYPIKLLWSKETAFAENLQYYAISELDDAPLAKKLNLSFKDFNFINDSWHPGDFQWRGMYLQLYSHTAIIYLVAFIIYI